MPLNEFERRFLEVTENHLDLQEAVRAVGGDVIPEYFGYVARFPAFTAAGQTQQVIIPMQADAWFVWQYVSVGVMLPNGSTFGDAGQMTDGGNILLNVTEGGTGHTLYSLPPGFTGAPAINLAGSPIGAAAGIPRLLPTPRLIPPNTNVKVEMTQFGLTALTNPLPDAAFFMMNGARIPLGALA